MAQRTFFGWLRLVILLTILLVVGLNAWFDRALTTDWDLPLRVTIYPLAADDENAAFASRLEADDFAAIDAFFATQAALYDVEIEEPVRIRVSHAAHTAPPARARDAGLLSTVLWSLRTRYWAWRVAANDPLPSPDIQIFAIYQRGNANRALPDSVGLTKGLYAIANLYADPEAAGSNEIVIAHELLHTLGATDKYDLATGRPRVPDGLAEPERSPLFPQQYGEIMAGRIALSPTEADQRRTQGRLPLEGGPVGDREVVDLDGETGLLLVR